MHDPPLHVGLQHAEGLLVAGDGHRQRRRQPLGREEVDDDPLRQLDRLRSGAADLLVEAEIDDQLLGSAGDATVLRP
jgi:hypothetical protein